MRETAGFGGMMMTAKLVREIDERESMRRNALSDKRSISLRQGSVVTVLETLDEGKAFLVEFGQRTPDTCDWLGVLYPSEIEIMRSPT